MCRLGRGATDKGHMENEGTTGAMVQGARDMKEDHQAAMVSCQGDLLKATSHSAAWDPTAWDPPHPTKSTAAPAGRWRLELVTHVALEPRWVAHPCTRNSSMS